MDVTRENRYQIDIKNHVRKTATVNSQYITRIFNKKLDLRKKDIFFFGP